MPGEQTQSEQNERRVAEYLAERYGLKVVRFSKAQLAEGKTPDFRVMKDKRLAFFCEVKTIARDEWMKRKLREAPPLTQVERIRTSDRSLGKDRAGPFAPGPFRLVTGSGYDRITSKILEAVEQFAAVNPESLRPNALFLINHDHTLPFQCLDHLLSGGIECENAEWYPVADLMNSPIKDKKWLIDLYVWWEPEHSDSPQHWAFSRCQRHFQYLCECFGKDPAGVRRRGRP